MAKQIFLLRDALSLMIRREVCVELSYCGQFDLKVGLGLELELGLGLGLE